MKKIISSAALVLVFTIALHAAAVHAGTTPVKGWAWSSNIGWLSFNSTDSGAGGGPYGVTVSTSSPTSLGAFGGYAWSSNIGWVSFQPGDVSGCPTGSDGTVALLNGCAPTVNLSTGAVTGWARILSSTAPENGGGWLQLSGTNHNTLGGGGVTYNPTSKAFSGYAYEPSAIGWIDFAAGLAAGGEPVCLGDCGPGGGGITGTCSASSYTVTPGTVVTLTASGVTGGSGSYTYSWSPLGTGNGSVTSANPYTYTYNSPGTYTPTIQVTGSVSGSGTLTCSNIVVSSPATSDLSLNIGVSVANANGKKTLSIRPGDSFVLVWENDYFGQAGYTCDQTVDNGGTWTGWGIGSGSNISLSSGSATAGTYHFTLSCNNGLVSYSDTVTLNLSDSDYEEF